MQPETRFKVKVVWPALKALPRTYARKIQNRAVRGIPDFLCCINGNFIALELKKSRNERLEPLQQWNVEEILDAGGLALPVYPENWEEIHAILKKIATGEMTPQQFRLSRGPLSS